MAAISIRMRKQEIALALPVERLLCFFSFLLKLFFFTLQKGESNVFLFDSILKR